MNKPGTPLAYRAFQDLGIEYRHAGCLSKVDNNEIGMLCIPQRAGYKTVTCFVRQLGKDPSFHCVTFRTSDRFITRREDTGLIHMSHTRAKK